jgi:Mor family transcriptional regulator
MRLSRNLCGKCGDRDALFVGIESNCCKWPLRFAPVSFVLYNGVSSKGRPPKLNGDQRREMLRKRVAGAKIKDLALEYQMSITHTRAICREVAA